MLLSSIALCSTSKVTAGEVGKKSTFTSASLVWPNYSRWHQLTNHSWLHVGAPGRKITLIGFQWSLLSNLWEWITQTLCPLTWTPPPQIAFEVLCLLSCHIFLLCLIWFVFCLKQKWEVVQKFRQGLINVFNVCHCLNTFAFTYGSDSLFICLLLQHSLMTIFSSHSRTENE